ncbi:MAG: fatty acid desaturase, partial [Saprospiraceae bacterium]|nr:fatty acid desaturase [Saprospiraceae bacterium]
YKKFVYRLYRSVPVMLMLGPIYYAGYLMRLPVITREGWEKTRKSQVFNNVYLTLIWVILALVIGWKEFFLVHIPIVFIFFVIAVWFFYVQHQHKETYKQWKENWEYLLAAIKGSSYYKLPKVFQWLTGNIGLHHIHHLSSKIPNYNLEKCAKENPIINKYATTLTFTKSLQTVFNHLWDEQQQKMISFRDYYRMEKMRNSMA